LVLSRADRPPSPLTGRVVHWPVRHPLPNCPAAMIAVIAVPDDINTNTAIVSLKYNPQLRHAAHPAAMQANAAIIAVMPFPVLFSCVMLPSMPPSCSTWWQAPPNSLALPCNAMQKRPTPQVLTLEDGFKPWMPGHAFLHCIPCRSQLPGSRSRQALSRYGSACTKSRKAAYSRHSRSLSAPDD